MANTTLSSREFDHDAAKARRAAKRGPVFITQRGHTSHVLLSIEEYQKIATKPPTIVDLLAMPPVADIEFDPVRSKTASFVVPDLS